MSPRRYFHVEVEIAQSSKHPDSACGDLVRCERTTDGTTLLCADGIGSGMPARIAAGMLAGRVFESFRQGFSLRDAFCCAASTLRRWREPGKPFVAFSLARIRTDAMATVLTYDAPPPLYATPRDAVVLEGRPFPLEGGLATESTCCLEPGEGLLLLSDGITQAGLGGEMPTGWKAEGVARYVAGLVSEGTKLKSLPRLIERRARMMCQVGGDDYTAVLALCRKGRIVNLLTGPPLCREDDARVVSEFLSSDGIKIVCGGVTAEVVAREMREEVDIERRPASALAPPRYKIKGIDLVTEGAVTLNQVSNLWDEDLANLEANSGVTDLSLLLHAADRVNLFVGGAVNRSHEHVVFRQQGILSREQVVSMLAQRFRRDGKLVVVRRV